LAGAIRALDVPGLDRELAVEHLGDEVLRHVAQIVVGGALLERFRGHASRPPQSVASRNVVISVEEGKDVTVSGSLGVTKQSGQKISPRVSASIAHRDLFGTGRYLGLEIVRARNDREFRALDAQASVPVVAREFSRMERLLIRVPVYGGDASVSLSAKLLSGRGSAMRDLAVNAGPAPGRLNEIDLPLAGLAAGEYLIDLTATSAGREVRDRLAIRVTP
jgi:hypothetical protein